MDPRFSHLTRDVLGVEPELEHATTFNRVVRASINRIWENVFDWEHLPVLHETYFNHADLLDRHRDGWRVKLSKQPGTPDRILELELKVDRANTRYCVRTLEGTGKGTRIWTLLHRLEPDQTAIEVRYYLPERQADRIEVIGEKYRCSCQQLWEEDEGMMMRREALTRRPPPDAAREISLGQLRDLRASLPKNIELGGHPYRLIELDGELLVHSTVCPHWLGPLEDGPDGEGRLRCPWHGYLFDARSGASADGRGLRLAAPPRIVVDPTSGEVVLALERNLA